MRFTTYLEHQALAWDTDAAATLIARTGFPVADLAAWYDEYGRHLSDRAAVVESFLGDMAKGAAKGAGVGAVGGSVAPGFGTLAGAGAGAVGGAVYGAGRNLWDRFSRWADPSTYNLQMLDKKKKEAVDALTHIRTLIAAIEKDPNVNLDPLSPLRDTEFRRMLDKLVVTLGQLETPQPKVNPTTPAPAAPTKDIRHNPDLDAAMGMDSNKSSAALPAKQPAAAPQKRVSEDEVVNWVANWYHDRLKRQAPGPDEEGTSNWSQGEVVKAINGIAARNAGKADLMGNPLSKMHAVAYFLLHVAGGDPAAAKNEIASMRLPEKVAASLGEMIDDIPTK